MAHLQRDGSDQTARRSRLGHRATPGLGPADPALDLVGAWHLLDDAPRQVLRDELGSDDLEWERGKAWAFEQSMGAVWYYRDNNPSMSTMGLRTLKRLVGGDVSR